MAIKRIRNIGRLDGEGQAAERAGPLGGQSAGRRSGSPAGASLAGKMNYAALEVRPVTTSRQQQPRSKPASRAEVGLLPGSATPSRPAAARMPAPVPPFGRIVTAGAAEGTPRRRGAVTRHGLRAPLRVAEMTPASRGSAADFRCLPTGAWYYRDAAARPRARSSMLSRPRTSPGNSMTKIPSPVRACQTDTLM